MLSRVLYGAQISVIIGLSAAALATVVSVVIGVVSGYLGGKVRHGHAALRRRLDELPRPDHPDRRGVGGRAGHGADHRPLGLLYGIGGSRIIRGAVVSVRENAYVHAAQSTGASTMRILWRHILPNVMAPVIVLFTTRVGAVILAESGLPSSGSACRRRRRPGAACCRARAAPSCTWAVARAGARPLHHHRGLRHQHVRRRCATCSIRACADRNEDEVTG